MNLGSPQEADGLDAREQKMAHVVLQLTMYPRCCPNLWTAAYLIHRHSEDAELPRSYMKYS